MIEVEYVWKCTGCRLRLATFDHEITHCAFCGAKVTFESKKHWKLNKKSSDESVPERPCPDCGREAVKAGNFYTCPACQNMWQ